MHEKLVFNKDRWDIQIRAADVDDEDRDSELGADMCVDLTSGAV